MRILLRKIIGLFSKLAGWNLVEDVIFQMLGLGWRLQPGVEIAIKSRNDFVVYNEIFVDGNYDVAIDAVLKPLPSGRPLQILDLGANVGFFAKRLAYKIAQDKERDVDFQITLIEGNAETCAELKKRITDPILMNRARIINALAGKREGCAKLYEHHNHGCDSVVATSVVEGESRKSNSMDAKEVEYVDILSLFGGGLNIDLLKCDIEGSEEVFLRTYQDYLKDVRYAIFELHHDLCDADKCLSILKEKALMQHKRIFEKQKISIDFFYRE